MTDTPRVYIVSPDNQYVKMFLDRKWKIVHTMKDADVVQFTGGEDVSPYLYSQPKHPQTFCNPHRDKAEQQIYQWCRANYIPMMGICRGGQFLNVMCGGAMIQHVDGHGGTHVATNLDNGLDYQVTSTHHQMIQPTKDATLLCVAAMAKHLDLWSAKERKFHRIETVNHADTEACWYEEQSCLCFQPHPEYMSAPAQLRDLYFSFIDKYILGIKTEWNE